MGNLAKIVIKVGISTNIREGHKAMLNHTKIAIKSKSGGFKGGGGSCSTRVSRKQSLSQLKKKCWEVFSRYIRTRDCLKTTGCTSFGLCFTCQKRYHIKLLQAGHFISGRHNANLFSEKGTNAQCYNCNINLRGNTLEYRRQIIKMYGEGADLELEKEARQIKKFSIEDLTKLVEYYKIEVEKLKGK